VTDCRLQPPAHAGSPLADTSTLKMEAIRSSETSVNARSTQHHFPEDDILQRKDHFLEFSLLIKDVHLFHLRIMKNRGQGFMNYKEEYLCCLNHQTISEGES
jgi:hypothetical protein